MDKRIFIAINLPEDIKQKLEESKEKIQALFPEEYGRMFNWVKKDNLHITLLFIGSVFIEQIPEIIALVKETISNKKSFPIKFQKISYGPHSTSSGQASKTIPPRLIWLEIEKNKELTELANELKEKFAEKGIGKFEQKSFSPHITLARIKSWQWKQIEPEERPNIEKEINLEFEVNSVEIMESQLKRNGAEYLEMESALLK